MPEIPEKPVLRQRPRMTDADRAALLEVLKREDVRIKGKIHVPTVSKLTGATPQAIYTFLRSDRYLKSKVAEIQPELIVPTEADMIDRKPQPTLPIQPTSILEFTVDEANESAAIRKQETKMLAHKWEELGMTAEQGKKWERYSKLGSISNHALIRGVGGQLIQDLTSLDELIDIDVQRVLGNLAMPSGNNKKGEALDPHQIENDIRHRIHDAMTLRLTMFSHLHRNLALLARAAADLQKINGQTRAAEKGEFGVRGAKKVS